MAGSPLIVPSQLDDLSFMLTFFRWNTMLPNLLNIVTDLMFLIPLPVMVKRSFTLSPLGENAFGINTRLLAQASRRLTVSLELQPSLL